MINDVHVSPEYVWSAGQGLSLDVPATMEFTDPKELGVYVNGVPLAASRFTVQKKEGSDAYAVSFVTAPAVGDRIVIARACKFDQPVNLHNYQAYDREVVERMFDRLTQMCGELKEKTSRAVLAPAGTGGEEYEAWVRQVTEPAKSAYDIWKEAGNAGSEADFLQSLKGEKGDKGDSGSGSAYTLPVAGDGTLGGVKVSSAEPKILYVAADGTLYVDVKKVSDALVTTQAQSPVAQVDGTPYLTVNHDGTLRVQHSGGKFELGVSPAAQVTSAQVADGGTVALHPSDAAAARRFTLAGAATLTLTSDDGTAPATAYTAYIDLTLDIPEGGSVAAESNVTLADALEAGKRNLCIVRCTAVAGSTYPEGTLYVCDAEDLPA